MTITWVFPRIYAPTPVWRGSTVAALLPVRPRRKMKAAATCEARPDRAGLDRGTARALAEAGYMSVERYVELFGGDNAAGEGEV